MDSQRNAAISAVRQACELCSAVQRERLEQSDQGRLTKEDRSPVTVADFGAQAVVSMALTRLAPGIPIVGEETADALRTEQGQELRAQVVSQVQRIEPDATEASVLAAIDECADAGGGNGRRWVLDPIDGTKGYLRGGQYAIALALLEDGEVVLGLLGCPSLPASDANGSLPAGCIFLAEKGSGTIELSLDGSPLTTVRVSDIADPRDAVFCESVEAAHSSHDRHQRIATELGVSRPAVRMDSQCKYGVVARGEAAIYLRLPTSESYREKIWDHAAGWLVVNEAGGRVTDVRGADLDFTLGRTLEENRGIVATNRRLHDAVLAAIEVSSQTVS